ncbi:septal ring lytic transglycosylase RlpA family protein [Acidicapsa acidisoli]|uniref:septal ring lytic transglycosylase RlpA family protein n=1 Tax=Acidicapsa acidisoli TaxID=1615681 RepID=UPI0021E0D547|nr:septal ring lytic transglycosylase RlpA family protein [Acidicapsa acidisoli]
MILAAAQLKPNLHCSQKRGFFHLAATAITILGLAGCSHKHSYPVAQVPAPPPLDSTSQPVSRPVARTPTPAPAPQVTVPQAGDETADDAAYVASHSPIYTEEGVASWYGPPYHNRQGANGKIFNQNAMTAAHRTLPMGSLIVVTNERTGQSATMRVTDRGPFVQGRLLDLSMASAKATGVYRAGLATVRIDVYQTPHPIEEGGRWCVQIGAFEHEHNAEKLRAQLERKYDSAQVIDFEGPTGYWVRIRPQGDNKEQAESIVRLLRPAEGDAYLVRLD